MKLQESLTYAGNTSITLQPLQQRIPRSHLIRETDFEVAGNSIPNDPDIFWFSPHQR